MPMQVCSAVQATARSSGTSTGCCSLGRKDARAVYSLQGCACVGRGSAAWIPDSQQMVWYPLRYSLAQHGLLSSQGPKPGPKGVRSVAGCTRAPILPLAFFARHPQMLPRFFVRDGTDVNGEDQDLRTSILIRDSPDRGEKQDNLRGEPHGSSSPHDKTHHGMMANPQVIFGLPQEILFTVITWNPESNCTCGLKNHSLFY